MMKTFLKHIIFVLVCAAAFVSCASDAPDPAVNGSGGKVRLLLRVGINAPAGETAGSRAAAGEYPDGYPYEFEDAATVYEGINTLRVIIVDARGVIEHNKVSTFPDRIPVNGDLYGDMEFGVKGDETKRVYLIANEASIVPAVDWTQYDAGSHLTETEMTKLVMYRDWTGKTASPYIDNTGVDKSYVPMTEFFDVKIKAAEGEGTVQSETLFITRAVVKFSFFAQSSSPVGESFRISSITFNSVMEKSYLIPNETSYLPAKYPLSPNFKRVVTAFETPGFSGNRVEPIVFTPASFGFNANGSTTAYENHYSPELYYCETRNSNAGDTYTVNCTVEWGDSQTTETQTVQLPNLPSFPRNTHVKVYFRMVERKLNASVVLMPYIGVWLNPTFGVGGDAENEGPKEIHPLSTH